ncbi:MAG: hypothetical protein QOJ16_3265 [Acidobacteriota bacterium]|nr:hypothetical protein [Acidobacteriota bacterium]
MRAGRLLLAVTLLVAAAGAARPATPAAPAAGEDPLAALATRLGEAGPDLLPRLQADLGAAAAARARRLAAQGEAAWTDREIADLLRLSLLDPPRFVDDPAFRERALGVLAQSLDRQAPAALRDRLLDQLGGFPGFDFAAGERVGWAWGALPRRSSERQIDTPALAGPPLRFDADDGGDGRSLAASVYSLPSAFFDAGTAAAFLAGVRAVDPERRIVVLADLAQVRALADRGRALHADLLLNHGRSYSPWPRDPFSLVHRGEGRSGRVVVLVRPNLQPGREEDASLGPELVQDLPPALDAAWGEPRWARAPVPFHNGQVLLTAGAAWITLHTLEPRILALLGESRVPVASFATAAGIARYLDAARRATSELADLYGRSVRFVHPLPTAGSALVTTLGGGAGYDLDSLVTLLPPRAPGGKPQALVADVAAGRALLARLPAADWQALAAGYGLQAEGLAPAMTAAQRAPRPEALAPYLDLIAIHLKSLGFAVDRLPLLFVPVPLLRDTGGLDYPDFLLTWNNVVVEKRAGKVRAEGFASLLPAGDAIAREVFVRAGVHLDLLPPLVQSVVRNGGYRCASNHLRNG